MTRILVVAVLLAAGLTAAKTIPPVPADDDALFDDARLLSDAEADTLRAIQAQSLDLYNTPIVVVTVQRLSDYGANTIEELATRWFNTWHIGTLGLRGGANQGILLLVAVQDRKARIELGGDWGVEWNAHAERIMDESIIPAFKRVEYPAGILDGVRALEKDLAMKGPRGAPPSHFIADTLDTARTHSLLTPPLFAATLGLGVLLLIVGIVRRSSFFVLGGLFFLMLALFTFGALVIALFFLRGRRRRHWWERGSGGSSGGGGGGFSGGSSRGGGATGSW
ncbi:MAG: TPM domain-containing protein [Archangium sp.]